ncbi:polysaccharide deacetylase family protein [Leeuwenhoekiella marinoflava]|uniref:polysaccharide deacetylase family protein n=1 Tax=Leeuwenhoekiella marinoflava TaxID=988 RepID=UPI0030038D1F
MSFKINLPVKTPKLLKRLYSGYVWDKIQDNKSQKKLYLTFDDGPIPKVTPWVLETLALYDAKATFFCIGENIKKNPHIFQQLTDSEHSIGNHTYNHLKGWGCNKTAYINNMLKTETKITTYAKPQKLFRPPYGKIKRSQAKAIQKMGYEIIMYDTIACDWEKELSGDTCAANVINNAESGSIVVFHDSLKAEKNMRHALPKVLDHFSKLGYTFEKL